ncbi:ABC transporter ATP-binding protein/permease [Convivina intestini]|uniref:ABC-type lipoprotein export system ATPase subunit n=1 Tax=Convivina intestini TaxID=1505726 RepID=A0A2U1DBL9_9LACO|nr:ABC transporter ATP-binding protein/permease [Convivina intestini]PVY84989.1 ABC-type lipoprotein export system ATPase subunit [Convivina intestini]CAH1853327.1 Macrolide export ATP-binding/permease protein MacB [Convivina intestini]SDB89583.1 ABC-type lipoprotein export system, ATPase component [Leuconostocaceae bacterium R-53105]
MAFLELHKITKSYYLGKQEFPVLKGIDLSFEKGEFVSILGESGGGKSTLMNIIGGLDRNFQGEVVVDGHLLDHHQAGQLDNYRRQTIGYIFQSFNLINYQTNLQNVETSLNMTTLSATERHERAELLLRKVGLGEHVHKYPSQLSGGQKQRVAIARALAGDPDVIIADEPTGALDSVNTGEVLVLLRQIAEEGKLVIMVTHSKEVADHSSRILYMENGHIARDRSLNEHHRIQNPMYHLTSRPLSPATIWSMAYEHLRYNWLQSLLIILGSAIGVFSVILFLGLGNGVQGYINQQVGQLANPDYPTVYRNLSKDSKLNAVEQIDNTQKVMATNYASTTINSDYLDKLSKSQHVKNIYPAYMLATANFSYHDVKVGSNFRSWAPNLSTELLKKGRKPLHSGEIVVSKNFASKIGSNWTKAIGKEIEAEYVAVDADNNPVNVTAKLKVVGITDGNQAAEVFAVSHDEMKAELAAAGALTDPNFVAVKIDKTTNVKEAVRKINSIKINGMQAFVAASMDDVLETIYRITNLATYVLAAISGISLLVSAIMIIVTTYMSVAERTKEIGVLRALGARQSDIKYLFTNESLLMAIVAAIIGIILAFIGQAVMNKLLYSLITYNIVHISAVNVLEAVAISIVITLAASFVPSRKAARLNTIEALAND